MDIKSLSASRVNLADANKEYTEAEKELSRQRSIRYEYFARQVELLKFDFVEEKYEKFIQEMNEYAKVRFKEIFEDE